MAFLAHLWESTGRAIEVTTVSASVKVFGLFFKRLNLRNLDGSTCTSPYLP